MSDYLCIEWTCVLFMGSLCECECVRECDILGE